jgi:hypothetical protein
MCGSGQPIFWIDEIKMSRWCTIDYIKPALCLPAGASDDVKQEAIRKATLRWHPDIEFTQKFGDKIQVQDG